MPSVRLAYGVGKNDVPGGSGTYTGGVNIPDPFYAAWRGMLERCYSEKFIRKYPTYTGCSVCEPWLTFSKFKAWMVDQRWEGWALDKDIIAPGNKIYSPDFCSFVPAWLNSFLCRNNKTHGDLPMGVVRRYPGRAVRYQAGVGSGSGHRVIGRFDTPEEAHSAFLKAKADETLIRIERYQQEGGKDFRIIESLLRQSNEMRAAA